MSRGQVEGRTLFFDYKMIPARSYCCEQLEYHHVEREKIILYIPQYREYGIRVSDDIYQKIKSCPWCGNALPISLKDKFFDILGKVMKKEVGISDLDKAPAEFKTDEWWKKRGL